MPGLLQKEDMVEALNRVSSQESDQRLMAEFKEKMPGYRDVKPTFDIKVVKAFLVEKLYDGNDYERVIAANIANSVLLAEDKFTSRDLKDLRLNAENRSDSWNYERAMASADMMLGNGYKTTGTVGMPNYEELYRYITEHPEVKRQIVQSARNFADWKTIDNDEQLVRHLVGTVYDRNQDDDDRLYASWIINEFLPGEDRDKFEIPANFRQVLRELASGPAMEKEELQDYISKMNDWTKWRLAEDIRNGHSEDKEATQGMSNEEVLNYLVDMVYNPDIDEMRRDLAKEKLNDYLPEDRIFPQRDGIRQLQEEAEIREVPDRDMPLLKKHSFIQALNNIPDAQIDSVLASCKKRYPNSIISSRAELTEGFADMIYGDASSDVREAVINMINPILLSENKFNRNDLERLNAEAATRVIEQNRAQRQATASGVMPAPQKTIDAPAAEVSDSKKRTPSEVGKQASDADANQLQKESDIRNASADVVPKKPDRKDLLDIINNSLTEEQRAGLNEKLAGDIGNDIGINRNTAQSMLEQLVDAAYERENESKGQRKRALQFVNNELLLGDERFIPFTLEGPNNDVIRLRKAAENVRYAVPDREKDMSAPATLGKYGNQPPQALGDYFDPITQEQDPELFDFMQGIGKLEPDQQLGALDQQIETVQTGSRFSEEELAYLKSRHPDSEHIADSAKKPDNQNKAPEQEKTSLATKVAIGLVCAAVVAGSIAALVFAGPAAVLVVPLMIGAGLLGIVMGVEVGKEIIGRMTGPETEGASQGENLGKGLEKTGLEAKQETAKEQDVSPQQLGDLRPDPNYVSREQPNDKVIGI